MMEENIDTVARKEVEVWAGAATATVTKMTTTGEGRFAKPELLGAISTEWLDIDFGLTMEFSWALVASFWFLSETFVLSILMVI